MNNNNGWYDTGKFEAWVSKWGVGPGIKDKQHAKKNGKEPPAVYTGYDGVVGEGWMDLLETFAKDMKQLKWSGQVNRISALNGVLRLDILLDGIDPADYPAANDILVTAETAARTTCENCGLPASLRYIESGRYWPVTLCNNCNNTLPKVW